MLGAVHVAERLRHHLLQHGNRVDAGLLKAKGYYRIHSGRMAIAAHVMAVFAACLAALLTVAEDALHQGVSVEVLEFFAADKAFVIHIRVVFGVVILVASTTGGHRCKGNQGSPCQYRFAEL